MMYHYHKKILVNLNLYRCCLYNAQKQCFSLENSRTRQKEEDLSPGSKCSSETFTNRKFIPITRRTLIRKVGAQSYLVHEDEKEKFDKLVAGLESALSQNFHGVLSDLKQLYDPLNPDKETMIAMHIGPKERLDNEFRLLEKLSVQLQNANFQELSREHISYALAEHPVYEGVLVHVDMKNYDVLRFWVLSEDEMPLVSNSWTDRVRNFINVRVKKWPKTVRTYKRVVLAVRTKKQNKLMLKAFKDIPKNGLEYFLPEGKIKMSKYDKGFIATTVTIGVLSIFVKILSALTEYHISWTYAVGGITGLLALRSWNAYKNKRNKYLINLSKSLYFKSIANNRALLTLIVDRSEDEILKSILLAYTFIRMENSLKVASVQATTSEIDVATMATVNELKNAIDSWMKNRFNIDVDFDAQLALKHLEEFGLLTVRNLGKNVHLSVPSLDKAIELLPTPELYDNREEELEIEDIFPENDLEILDIREKRKQLNAESGSLGWK